MVVTAVEYSKATEELSVAKSKLVKHTTFVLLNKCMSVSRKRIYGSIDNDYFHYYNIVCQYMIAIMIDIVKMKKGMQA